MDNRPTLIINPGGDAAFRELAERLASAATTPSDLEAALRESYPRTVVHERGLSAEATRMWYVYREGRWVRPNEVVSEREHD